MSLNKSGHSGHPNHLMEPLISKQTQNNQKENKVVIVKHEKMQKNDKLLNHDLLEETEPIVHEPDPYYQRAHSEILSVLP